jgi:hypothetical protein
MNRTTEKLIVQIEKAFHQVKLGDGISLNMTEYLDSYRTNKMFADLAKQDERNDWTKISNSVLEQFTVTFCFTDWQGFRFYLPAYMRWKLNNPASDNFIGDHTIYALDIKTIEELQNKKITEILNDEQIEVVVKFLNWCVFDNSDNCDSEFAKKNLQSLEKLLKN